MREIIRKSIRKGGDRINVVSNVNAVVASNTGRCGEHIEISRRQRVRVVQRDGHTVVTEENDEEEPRDG